MPLTSMPFERNLTSHLYQEALRLTPAGLLVAPTETPRLLRWILRDDTYRLVHPVNLRFFTNFGLRPEDKPSLHALAAILDLRSITVPFSGDAHLPVIGESHVTTGTESYAVYLVALHADTRPAQPTLSQALAAIVPDIMAEYPGATDADLVTHTVTTLATRFHLIVCKSFWRGHPVSYQVYRNARSPQLISHFSPLLLPLLKAHLQPA